MVEIKKSPDQIDFLGVDAFKFAKQLGKHRFLGNLETLTYQELFNRIKHNLDFIHKIQKKKKKSQREYENKISNVLEV